MDDERGYYFCDTHPKGNAPEAVREKLREAAREDPKNFINSLINESVRTIDKLNEAKLIAGDRLKAARQKFEDTIDEADREVASERRRIADFTAIMAKIK